MRRKVEDKEVELFEKFTKVVEKESDMVLSILSATIIDQLLLDIIKKKLLHTEGEIGNRLFEGERGLLGTLSSKIKICYQLGLFDEEFCKTLNFIRKIRNSFAHTIIENTFSDERVKGHLSSLSPGIVKEMKKFIKGYLEDYLKNYPKEFKKKFDNQLAVKKIIDDTFSPRKKFELVVAIVIGRLEGLSKSVVKIDPQKFIPISKSVEAIFEYFKKLALENEKNS